MTIHRHHQAAIASSEYWELAVRGDRYLHIRIRRNTLIAIMLSVLLHALLLLQIAPIKLDMDIPTANNADKSIRVQLASPDKPAMPSEDLAPPPPPVPEVKPAETKPAPAPVPKEQQKEVMAVEKPKPAPVVTPPAESPRPRPEQTAPAEAAPPTDMLAYVKAARERRQQAEREAARQNAAAIARERSPTAEELRNAAIERNLQPRGTNGIFQIISMTPSNARYSFHGWTNDFSNARRQVIEVEAGPDGDIERALVRSMIALIRTHHDGDFNWESHRLGRVVILSARRQDNAELEAFLIKEFFR